LAPRADDLPVTVVHRKMGDPALHSLAAPVQESAHVVVSWCWVARAAATRFPSHSLIRRSWSSPGTLCALNTRDSLHRSAWDRASAPAAGCWARAAFRRWYAALVSLSSLTECQMVSKSATSPSTPTGALGGGCRCSGYSPSGRSIPSEVGRMNVVVLPPSESLRLTSFATACASAGGCGAAASMAV